MFPCLTDFENPRNVLGIPRNRGAPALRDCACTLPAREWECGCARARGEPGPLANPSVWTPDPLKGPESWTGEGRRQESWEKEARYPHTYTHSLTHTHTCRGGGWVTSLPSIHPPGQKRPPSNKFTHLLRAAHPGASCSGSWHTGGKMPVAPHSKQR